MRSFLYLTPRFAPAATVGALRAVKFCRHLPSQGWRPVVLSDMEAARGFDPSLEALLPAEISVEVGWRPESVAVLAAMRAGLRVAPDVDNRGPFKRGLADRIRATAPALIDGPRALLQELKLPLSANELRDIQHAVEAARRLVVRERCEAIVASGPPWQALVVGALVARLERLPLLLDFRDPWALCELDRVARSWMEQQKAQLLERWCVWQATALLLNTDAARDDYERVYGGRAGLRIETLRNHAEAWERGPEVERSGPFRLVCPGRLRDRVMSQGLVRALAALAAEGWGPDRLVLEVAGPLSRRAEAEFRAADVLRFVQLVNWKPQSEVSAWLATGDLQIVLNAATRQRIPAKFYESLMVPRPVLVCGATPEMATLTAGMEGVALCDREDDGAIAAAIRAALTGRRAAVVRETGALTSEAAAARLAELLCAVSPRPDVASPSSDE
ncbi:MAG: hypothetical protein HQ461_05250 [Deltaproteobacteria bacterium]|nr:hypothetical protein [Deltaproteobacteria bacterium]